VLVVAGYNGPPGGREGRRAWDDRLRTARDGVRADWAADTIRLAGRPDSEAAPIEVINLSREAKLHARLGWVRGTVTLPRGRVGPGGEWASLVWFDVRGMTAPPAEAPATTSPPADAVASTTAALPPVTVTTVVESMRRIWDELDRRGKAGEPLCNQLRKQAAALLIWLSKSDPTAPAPALRSVENAIRGRFKKMTASE
jgi:hypothetical protein